MLAKSGSERSMDGEAWEAAQGRNRASGSEEGGRSRGLPYNGCGRPRGKEGSRKGPGLGLRAPKGEARVKEEWGPSARGQPRRLTVRGARF